MISARGGTTAGALYRCPAQRRKGELKVKSWGLERLAKSASGLTAEARVALNHTDATPATRSTMIAAVARLRTWFADRSDDSLARRAAATALLIRCVSAALVYGTQILLARWMGGFAFGVYVYVWTWVLLLGGLVDFGLSSAAQRFVPEYSKLSQWDLLRGFLRGSRLITLVLATGAALLGALMICLSATALDRFEVVPLYLARCPSSRSHACRKVSRGRVTGSISPCCLPT